MKYGETWAVVLGYLILAGSVTTAALTPDRPRRLWDFVVGGGTTHSSCFRPWYPLKTLATAQADFRANDRDGDGTLEFWTGDVAGLYALRGADGRRIKLIDISTAGADAHPVTDIGSLTTPEPKTGYYFKSLRPPDEADWWGAGRFGFCAYPAAYGKTGTYTYIIGEHNTIMKKDLGPGGAIDAYPANPEAEGWRRLD